MAWQASAVCAVSCCCMTSVGLGSPPALQDTDGTAYLVRSVGSQLNDHIGISRLAPDYLATRPALHSTAMSVRTPCCMRTCHGSVSCVTEAMLLAARGALLFCKGALRKLKCQAPAVHLVHCIIHGAERCSGAVEEHQHAAESALCAGTAATECAREAHGCAHLACPACMCGVCALTRGAQ